MKRILILFLLLVLPLCLVGCGGPFRTVGNTTTEKPVKTAVLFSSLAEIWREAGGEICITVGETLERGFAAPDVLLVDKGAGKTINLELLLSYCPDLVIYSEDIPAQTEAAAILEQAGIATLGCRVESFQDYLETLRVMTEITGKKEAYDAALVMAEEIDALVASISAQGTSATRILFVRAGSTASSTKAKLAEDHFACAMLEEFGCINIADDAPVLLDGLSMEHILTSDPTYIFFSLMGNEDAAMTNVKSLLGGEAWGRLTAVREGRAVILPKELFHFKPCGRWGEAYAYLADILTEGE